MLDLAVIVHPRDLKAATVRSLLAESLAACDAQQLAALDEPLEKLRRAHPDDLSVAIAATLKAMASGESSQAGPALERLDRLVERTPLEPLPPGGRANARQRAEAARQVPLWLVARACNRRPDAASYRAIAERLSARALEAARRQADNLALLAMVREQGEIAMARGDRKAAEASWGRLLDLIMPAPTARTRRAQPVRGQPGPGPAGRTDAGTEAHCGSKGAMMPPLSANRHPGGIGDAAFRLRGDRHGSGRSEGGHSGGEARQKGGRHREESRAGRRGDQHGHDPVEGPA